jgi:O-antigen ligase
MLERVPGYADARAAGHDVTRLRGYRRGERAGNDHVDYLTRDHAHSTYMQTLAGQGAIGLALLVTVLIVIGRQCWRDRPDHPYSDGMLFALLCWIVGAQFDCYELNGHQLGLIALIAALTLPGRAKVRWKWSARD